MPLISRPQSVRRRTVSVLAITETIIASSISLWLAWKHDSLTHLVIAGALAPFLLLRTRLSTWYTIGVISYLESNIAGLFIPALSPIVKAFCTARVFLRHPFTCLRNIPTNFYTNVFVLDFTLPPQVVPGIEEIKSPRTDPGNAYDALKIYLHIYVIPSLFIPPHLYALSIWRIIIFRIFMFALKAPFVLGTSIFIIFPILIISFSFRFAIKSTALFWLPLLWIIHKSKSKPGQNVLDVIGVNLREPWTKVTLCYSLFVIIAFLWKLSPLFATLKVINVAGSGQLGLFTKRIVAPFELPLWQVTSAINAGLGWAFFFRAHRHLLAQNSTVAWPQSWIEREYVAFQAIRATFTVYAIACTFYIAAATAWQTEWPPIRLILFPFHVFPTE